MLNERQRRFAAEYIVDLNATQSAIRAGYSEKTAGQQGHDLLKKPEIQAEIQHQLRAREARLELSQDRVVMEFLRLAMANMGDYTSWGTDVVKDADGNCIGHHSYVRFVPSEELTRDQLAAVQEITEVRKPDGIVEFKIKLHDKCGPLNSLAKHLGMFLERHKIDGGITVNTFADLVKAAAAGAADGNVG